MSEFSGKCDLFDDMIILGGVDGIDDEYTCFQNFKKRVNGVIYQANTVKVTKNNLDDVAKHNSNFSYRQTGNNKYIYTFFGQEYTNLKDLNKQHILVFEKIHIDTIFDIIPYYPYIVIFECGSTVVIDSMPYFEYEKEQRLKKGWPLGDFTEYYRKRLQRHYAELVDEYGLEVLLDECGHRH